MHKFYFKSLLFLFALYTFCASDKAGAKSNEHNPLEEIMCKSATIRSVNEFNQLQNCTLVTGYVRIVQMEFTRSALRQLKSSNIEEITEYLLVYRAEGLDSLERLFPKLILIRGVELLYDQYALIILENRDLKNIGLVSLLRVLKGSIRVEYNPLLCFAKTINWVSILGNTTKEYFYAVENNKPFSQCPLCYTYRDELETIEVNRHKKCWSIGKFQKSQLDFTGGKKCSTQSSDSNCLTSCSDSDCKRCSNFVSSTGCVDNCLPPKYRLAYKRQCVINCADWGLVQMGMKCVEKCPKHYEEIRKNGVSSCSLKCLGHFIVHHVEDLEGLADCSTIQGSLTIELYETERPIVQDLEKAFRHLNEITGYLKIINSPQIVSLHFFKNLHSIRGGDLLEDRYSLYVVDNNYLQALFPGNVAIMSGCIYFHLNPRLCYDKIADLQKNFRECKKITVKDVSVNSNGERVVCGEDIRDINATVTDLNSNAAVIEVDFISQDDLYLLVGYNYYYKEAPTRNVTKYDGRHGCGIDGWFMDTVLTQRRRHILKNLKPATQYAFFVNSMMIMDYPYLGEHVTKIHYFQTLPSKPGMVANVYSHSLSTREIEIHWWPPRVTNGIIEKYILQYAVANSTLPYENVYQNMADVCQCPKLDTESHIPTPHPQDFYSKEKLSYKDSLMNFLFVKRPESNTTVESKISDSEIQDRWIKIMEKWERENIEKQEKDKESYVLPHPPPVCYSTNPNAKEKQCTPLDTYDDAIEIPSHRHSYLMNYLEPEQTYRISIRACVKDLANGCGPEKVILAETVSKRIETILESLTLHKL